MNNFRFLLLISLVAVSMTFVGCRHANKLSQFSDDAVKYGDDVIRVGKELLDDDEKKVNVSSSSYNTYDYDEPAETYYYEPQPVLVPCNVCGAQGFIVDVYSGYAYDCAFCDYGMVQSYQ